MSNVRLDSWKSIATYFGRGVRTVQRWQIAYGMPVYHFGGDKGSVFAYSVDLDRWLAGKMGVGKSHKEESKLLPAEKKTISEEQTARANKMWLVRSENNLPAIAALYREAAGQDPENSEALIGLARSLVAQVLLGTLEGPVVYPSAREALRNSGGGINAKSALAVLDIIYERQWEKAKSDIAEVLQITPNDAYALFGCALLHTAEGNLPDAYRFAVKAWRVNPLAGTLAYYPIWIQYLGSKYNQAQKSLSDIMASGVCGVVSSMLHAFIMTATEEPKLNVQHINTMVAEYPKNSTLTSLLGYNYAVGGDTENARKILHRLWSEYKQGNCGYQLAIVLIGLGRSKEAIQYLDSAYKEGSIFSIGFKNDPLLQSLKGDPYFESLLQKIGPTAKQPLTEYTSVPELYRFSTAAVTPGRVS